MNNRTSYLLLLLSILTFAVSLATPAFWYDGGPGKHDADMGWEALVLGWFPAIFGIFMIPTGNLEYFGTFSWLASPVLWMSWVGILMKSKSLTVNSACAAICLSLLFFTCRNIPVPDNQSMNDVSVGIGYFIWLLSMGCSLIAGVFLKPKSSTNSVRK